MSRVRTVILDIGGVMIPSTSVTRAMQRTFGQFGMTVSSTMIARAARGSKREHISKILDTHFPLSTSKTLNSLVKLYPEVQLETFIEDPEDLCKLLPGVLKLQKLDNTALVVTTMFPQSIVTYLRDQFTKQGFRADAFFSATQFTERSDMIDKAMKRFPSAKTFFIGDTVADMASGSQFENVVTIGLFGHSAESPKGLSNRMLKAGADCVSFDLTDLDWLHL